MLSEACYALMPPGSEPRDQSAVKLASFILRRELKLKDVEAPDTLAGADK